MKERIPTPEQFFGFRIGKDRKLARWDRIVEYYRTLAARSERDELIEMGSTSMEAYRHYAAAMRARKGLKRMETYSCPTSDFVGGLQILAI